MGLTFEFVIWAGDQLAVTDSAVGLADAAGISTADLEASEVVVFSVKNGGVRWRCSGDPAAGDGVYHDDALGPMEVRGTTNLVNLRFIRDEDSSGSVIVDFELGQV